MTPQVLSQDLSISHDFLGQDSQETHALAKKSSTMDCYTRTRSSNFPESF
jgi:hypothetical protein